MVETSRLMTNVPWSSGAHTCHVFVLAATFFRAIPTYRVLPCSMIRYGLSSSMIYMATPNESLVSWGGCPLFIIPLALYYSLTKMCSCHVAHILLQEADVFHLSTVPAFGHNYVIYAMLLINVSVYVTERCQTLLQWTILQLDDDQMSVVFGHSTFKKPVYSWRHSSDH